MNKRFTKNAILTQIHTKQENEEISSNMFQNLSLVLFGGACSLDKASMIHAATKASFLEIIKTKIIRIIQ